MKKERWTVKNKKADFQSICRNFGVSELAARLLVNRGITEEEDINEFLRPETKNMSDPFLMKDLKKACTILNDKIEQGKRIRIVGDYDVDGVVSTYLLLTALKRLGASVDYQIPDRKKDGYGINISIVEQAVKDAVDTVLTCDNGIAAAAQVRYAMEHNITVIITDHHDIPEELPEAAAVVNPKQADCEYPYPGLCGAGVAYKLIQGLYTLAGIQGAEELLEFTAIATVCDVMELTGENRIITACGINQLRRTENLGLLALMEEATIDPEQLNTYHLGYILGPCLNATGRLDSAIRGVELLNAGTREEAVRLAKELKNLNDIRKEMTAHKAEEAFSMAEKEEFQNDRVLVLFLPDCHESLAGIIAGRLRERYNKPAIVLTRGEELVKGSGRSIEGYHMFEELSKCKQYLSAFGGHPMAAGMSLVEDQVEPFRCALNEQCALTEEDLTVKVSIDVVLALSGLTEEGIEELNILEPFGKGNEKPVFADKQLKLVRLSLVGKNTKYVKLLVEDRFGCQMDAMYFGDSAEFLSALEPFGEDELRKSYQGRGSRILLSVVYYPGINEYNGRRSKQIVIQRYQLELQ